MDREVIFQVHDSDSPTTTTPNHTNHRTRCCFHLPCFSPGPTSSPSHITLGHASSSSLWDRIRVAESESKWWARPITAFKKIREWSEIVAGPKWKTFIRRFNKKPHRHHRFCSTAGKFQYDPLSYALNFDEGQNGHFNGKEDDDVAVEHFPDFSSRFAALPISARSSMDLGKVAPAS